MTIPELTKKSTGSARTQKWAKSREARGDRRVTVWFNEQQYAELTELSQRTRKDFSEIIRDSVRMTRLLIHE